MTNEETSGPSSTEERRRAMPETGVQFRRPAPSTADQVAALIAAVNYVRCAREAVAAQELHGTVDVLAETQSRLRAQLQQLTEEGMSVIPLPELMGLRT